MEPAPIVMVMGQGKETQGGEGREGAESYQYICSACSDDRDELGFYLMEESHVDWSRISFLSNLVFFFFFFLFGVSQWVSSGAGSEILTLWLTFYGRQLGCAGEILLVNNLGLQEMFDFLQVKHPCGFRRLDLLKPRCCN